MSPAPHTEALATPEFTSASAAFSAGVSWRDIGLQREAEASQYLLRARERRSSLENPQSPLSFPAEWLLDIFNGGRTDSGIRVSELTALQVATVFACVNLISSTIGALPLQVFERLITGEQKRLGKRVAVDHDLHDVLHDEPNPEMTSITFRRTLQLHMLLWGNGYAEVQRDGANRIVALWPRNPARCRPYRTAKGLLVYRTTEGIHELVANPEDPDVAMTNDQPERTIFAEDMLHMPGLTLDGRLGSSTIWLSRQVVGLALAAEKYGSKFFANGARPGGVLQVPNALKDVAREQLKRSWAEAQGGENMHRVAVLEQGVQWKETGGKNNEAQFLETRQFQKSEICSIFAVPPHMIGDTEKTNRANTEQIGVEFVNYTLAPWLESWQQELKRKLFPKIGRNASRFFAQFDTRGLKMPDANSRKEFYSAGRQWTFLSPNDIREIEHLNQIDEPWADEYLIPINMGTAGAPPPAQPAPQNPQQEPKP